MARLKLKICNIKPVLKNINIKPKAHNHPISILAWRPWGNAGVESSSLDLPELRRLYVVPMASQSKSREPDGVEFDALPMELIFPSMPVGGVMCSFESKENKQISQCLLQES